MATDADERAPPNRALGTGAILLLVPIGLLYLAGLVTALELRRGGDPQSAMGAAPVLMGQFVMWPLIAWFLILACRGAGLPRPVLGAAALLVPLAAIASFAGLFGAGDSSPWVLATPALLPPLLIAFGLWARAGAGEAERKRGAAQFLVAAVVLMLPVALAELAWRLNAPVREAEQRAYVEDLARREAAYMAALGPDSRLADFLVYSSGEDPAAWAEATRRLRTSRWRQPDTVAMLREGRIDELTTLWDWDLEATPELCETYRAALRHQIVGGGGFEARGPIGAFEFDEQFKNMEWLAARGCDLSEPLAAYEARAGAELPPEHARPRIDFVRSIQAAPRPDG